MLRLLALLLIPLSQSCLWDTDTLRDEANLRPDLWELVSGQVPAHGEAYYRQRVARIVALPTATREQRNDLAVAYIRLGDLPAADVVLTALRREDPGEYQALSNQAVLRRNQGDFLAAIPLFEQALALKPEGHLGLGDWTLQAVRYRQRTVENAVMAIRRVDGWRASPTMAQAPAPYTSIFG